MRLRTTRLLGAVVLVVAACGTSQGDETTVTADESGATTTSESAADMTTTAGAPEETTTTAAEMVDAAHLGETDLGLVLVDPDGFTLYVFDADTDGESSCYDSCANNWPPVPADTAIGADLDRSLFASTTRTDGSEQLTINGMPLYRFASDSAPGDTNGEGINGLWWVVDGQGSVIEASAPDAIVIDYGY